MDDSNMDDPALNAAGLAASVAGSENGGSFLPPFANAENKALDKTVRDLEKELEALDATLEENTDRIKIMDEHLVNVQQELKYTQSRVEAKHKEIDTEQHLKALADREMGRLRKDIEKLVVERTELADKVNNVQQQIYRGNERMDQFKLLMNWNQEELEQWALAERQKAEDKDALAKYQGQDSAKMKELMLALEKLSRGVVAKKEELESEVVETQAAQIQLDKAAEDFRKLHAERQDLIRQWDEAMEAMRHRDAAIAAASEMFAMKRVELREKQAELDAQAAFLDNETVNSKEVDARIAFYEREAAKQREVHAREVARVDEAGNQVELVKATLGKAATELSQKTIANTGARSELDAKRQKLDAARKKHAILKRRLETEFQALDSLEAKVSELESMRRNEEARLKGVLKEHEDLKKEQFRRNQRLFDLRTKERELISEISGGQSQNKNMAARITALDEQVVRQQELLYNVEFQLQQMERKVARAGGSRSEEETRVLNARIEKLTAVLEGVNAEHSMLLEQVKHAEDDLLKARRANTGLRTDKGKIDETIGTLKLENEMAARQVKQSIDAKERSLVDHDVMQLEVKRLRDILAMAADEVFSLENRKAQLKMSMEERKHEVEVHRDGLRMELKIIREDVHRLILELKERMLKVEKLRSKFETISSKQRSIADDGEPKSQAYYVIKAAQEREELQREGDQLDARIRQAEKEVAALETTLGQLMAANQGFGQSFKKVDNKTSFHERAALRDKLDKAYDKLKLKRQEEGAMVEDLSQAQARVANLDAERRTLQAGVDELRRRKAEAQRAVEEQMDKVARARRASERIGARVPTAAQDVAVAEVRETARAMLLELKALAAQNPGAGIAEAVEAAGLRLPTGPGTGSVSSSRQGNGSLHGDSRPGSARSGGSAGSISRHSMGSAAGATTPGGSFLPPIHRSPSGGRPGSGPGSAAGSVGGSPAIRTIQLGAS